MRDDPEPDWYYNRRQLPEPGERPPASRAIEEYSIQYKKKKQPGSRGVFKKKGHD